MSRRSFNSVRSYYFRAHCARVDREVREYGGRPLDAYTLEDFRDIWTLATSSAINWARASTNHATKSWDRPFRRIVR